MKETQKEEKKERPEGACESSFLKPVENMQDINRSIIVCRGIYSRWAQKMGLSYNEMLVLYTLREKASCTQKQICDQYLLPRQTMNHVFSVFKEEGFLEKKSLLSPGKEQAFVLTEKGKAYAEPFFQALDQGEQKAAHFLGTENLEKLTELMKKYDRALYLAFEETGEQHGNQSAFRQ